MENKNKVENRYKSYTLDNKVEKAKAFENRLYQFLVGYFIRSQQKQ